jgi:mono/diheme cytochrome c family protein
VNEFVKTIHGRFRGRLRTVLTIALLGMVLGIGMLGGRWLKIRRSTSKSGKSTETQAPLSDTATTNLAARGDVLFQIHCAKCHGPEGHGEEEAMERMRPPPRDFASRPWRYQVDADSIRRVTAEGIPGTAMPSFRTTLSQPDLDVIVEHTYRLATTPPIVTRHRSQLEDALVAAHFIPEGKGRLAPKLQVSDAAGHARTLADERGRIVLLNFWGMTCAHCVAGMSKLQALADRWEPQGLTVLNVCADAEDAGDGQRVIARSSPKTQIWIDDSGLANSEFGVQVMPTIWLIDVDGQMLGCAYGMQDWDAPAINELIKLCIQQTRPGLRLPRNRD